MCWPVSRAGHVFAGVIAFGDSSMHVQVSARIKSSACTSTSLPMSKAEHIPVLVGVHSKQCWYLDMLSCIEGFACVRMCVHVLKT